MSEVNKEQSASFNDAAIEELYRCGTNTPAIGTEIETWIVRRPASPGLRAEMMTPDDSQALLEHLAQQEGSIVFCEDRGIRKAGRIQGLPMVYVETQGIAYQLELSGVLETATLPVSLKKTNQLLSSLRLCQRQVTQIAAKQGLTVYPLSILGSATVEDCEKNMVNRERLRSEWAKFKSYGDQSPGLRTMGLAASVQVSLGYKNDGDLRDMMRLAYLLSPLLTAAFANSSGFVEGVRRNEISRPRWWLEHNAYAPRAGIPPFMLNVMFSQEKADVVTGWIDYAKSTPMVYFYDKKGNATFDASPTFNELRKDGNGTLANFYLAESLLWPDVKLIGGKRMELRMCDSGPWQAESLTVIAATLLANPQGRERTNTILSSLSLDPEAYTAARAKVSQNGLDTAFGSTTLRNLLPPVLDIVLKTAGEMGINKTFLTNIKRLKKEPVSDFEKWKSASFADAASVDSFLCEKAEIQRKQLAKPTSVKGGLDCVL